MQIPAYTAEPAARSAEGWELQVLNDCRRLASKHCQKRAAPRAL